ncbi:MAG: 16S rRNA methyltransferase [Anaerolineae bacterium]|nr:16S rRNA methyltransferase [Anaerolineae bacterium]
MGERNPLDELRRAVLASSKYHRINPLLVERIGADELAKGRKFKDAVKAVKNKLHQIGAAYLPGRMDYAAWLASLHSAAQSAEPQALQNACREVMGYHASTRERLPILEQFYATVLAGLPPIHSVLDLACGFNPLAIPWMSLAPGAAYFACDIYQDMTDFIQSALDFLPVKGEAFSCDLLTQPPDQKVQLALLLKTIPCLEQVDKEIGAYLLENINAHYMLVSFPIQSLGGKKKGMLANYETHFAALAAGKDWSVTRFEFATELAFLVHK